MAHDHLKRASAHDLMIYDRGYPCFSLFSAHRQIGCQFLMRLPSKFSKETTEFENSEKIDSTITLKPNRPETKRRCIESGVSVDAVQLRLIKVKLPDGKVEILVTSLIDENTYHYGDFKDLYALRWDVEEDFKVKKVWMEYENFSGKSIESVYQDIYAKLFVQNIAGLIIWSASALVDEKYKNRVLNYKINKAQGLSNTD